MTDAALFDRDGDAYLPTQRSVGPWDPKALHGGPPTALIAGALERMDPGPEAFAVTRLTVEILRPVPVAPLTLSSRVIRPGKKVQLLEASLTSGNQQLVRASAVRIRRADLPFAVDMSEAEPPPLPERDSIRSTWGWEGFHNTGVTQRYARGSFLDLGPATVWVRLNQPVVAGEEPTPLQRVAAAADFGNGVSSLLRFDEAMFINPDLTIYLHRPPRGEWVAIEASTQLTPDGVGLAQSVLYDRDGAIGRALQSLFVDRR